MHFIDLLNKKKRGLALSTEEINCFVEGYCQGHIPDYQVSAFLMAIYFQGMTVQETADLTLAMANSGDRVDLSSIPGVKVDKHSTGGVGDKTSLIISPILAALGIKLAKMSGRGLGHTGGTVDKLESIPGLKTDLSLEEFFGQVKDIGLAIAGQTANLAPADKKLYALRDVTATVDNMSLIAASILSKKIAAGSDRVVFDVKCGSGAFMKTEEEAKELAILMRDIGAKSGLAVHSIVSDMNQPLGRMVGNRLEVYESIETLKGRGPEDLKELCFALAGEMLVLSGMYTEVQAEEKISEVIVNGAALEKFRDMVAAQGGDVAYIDEPERLLQAGEKYEFLAEKAGYVTKMDSEAIGTASLLLGAGRRTLDDVIDFDAGLIFEKKLGDQVEKGDLICTLYSNDRALFSEAIERLKGAIELGELAYRKKNIVLARIC